MKRVKLPVPRERIAEFCRKWHVIEFNLFGSVLRDDFRAESDVDVLLRFAPGHGIGFDNRVEMEDELAAIFGPVRTRDGLGNRHRDPRLGIAIFGRTGRSSQETVGDHFTNLGHGASWMVDRFGYTRSPYWRSTGPGRGCT